jgi:lipopolysaccharide/colanic/teichoic acid biosynthesis glycosyltransferase
VLNLRKDPFENLLNRGVKRAFDLAFSLVVILAVFPWLFPLIALFIKLSSKGQVFFKQLRSGKGNRPFLCYKFRTMRLNSLSDKLQATKNDSRITPIGRFLRNTSMDELPQFFNVFLGNMSVVGPRPHMLLHTEKYSKEINKYMARHFVKQGITGLAQVHGCRGETTDKSMMDKRIQWDLRYIENWSFYSDLKIIFLTLTEMLRGKIKGA